MDRPSLNPEASAYLIKWLVMALSVAVIFVGSCLHDFIHCEYQLAAL